MTTTKVIGDRGEAIAKTYLEEKGYIILECNYRYQKAEIDIIAEIEDFLVIVEVKARKQHSLTTPEDSVDLKKQQLLISAAQHYIVENDLDEEARFDIVSVIYSDISFKVNHIEEAFSPMIK